MPDTDTYAASKTMIPLFVSKQDEVHGGHTAISFGRASEPSLKQRAEYLYRSLSMGFGLEGVN